jgi:hypothetical protein
MPGGVASAFVPTDFAGLKLWLRADLGVTVTGSGVSTWADQSGIGDSNRNHTQSTDAQRPTVNASDAAYNGKPTLSFAAASSQTLVSGTWSVAPPSSDFTLVIVGNADNAATTEIFISDDAAWEWSLFQSTTDILSWFGSAQLNATPITLSAKHVMVMEQNGASSGIYVDSTTVRPESVGNPGSPAVAVTRLGGQGGARFLNGKIAEVILYTPRLAAPDLATLLTYIGTRYGITIS